MKSYEETMEDASVRLGTVLYHSYMSGCMSHVVHGVGSVAGTIAFIYDRDDQVVCEELVRRMEAYSDFMISEND